MVIAAGCGGSSDTSTEVSGDSLSAALADVHVKPPEGDSTTDAPPFYLSWVDTARLRDLADLPDSSKEAITEQRWQLPVGLAIGDPIANQINAVDYGFDPFTGDRTVTVGQPPDAATRWDGVDTGGVEDAFGKLGFERRGDFIALGGEGEFVQDSVDQSGVGPIGINRVETEGDSLALGAYEDPVEAALGKAGDPASDTEGAGAVADCLGDDAFAAILVDPEDGASDDVSLIGVGLVGDGSGEGVEEVLCAGGTDGGSIDDLADCMDSQFNDGGVDPVTGQEFSALLGSAQIETGDAAGVPWARASFSPPDPDGPVGLLFQMLQRSGFSGPLGGDPGVTAAGRTATPEQIEALQAQGCDASS